MIENLTMLVMISGCLNAVTMVTVYSNFYYRFEAIMIGSLPALMDVFSTPLKPAIPRTSRARSAWMEDFDRILLHQKGEAANGAVVI